MKIIQNKTRRPLKIRLSQGRILRLGPGKEGQIAVQDANRQSVNNLVEAGDVEIFDDLSRAGGRGADAASQRFGPQTGHRTFSGSKHGDR